jgi:hypothetical protein
VTGQTYVLTTGVDTITESGPANTIIAGSETLSAFDSIDGGTGTDQAGNTLLLQGGGSFLFFLPSLLTHQQTVIAQEGQPDFFTPGGTGQILVLPNDLNTTVDVLPAAINPANLNAPSTIIIRGGRSDASTINLAAGNDVVEVNDARTTVNGGSGNDTIVLTEATIGSRIDGGGGYNTLEVTHGGTMTMGDNLTNIQRVVLTASHTEPYHFTADATPGLEIFDATPGFSQSFRATIAAGGPNQTLRGNGNKTTMMGFIQGSTLFRSTSAAFQGDTIGNFGAPGSAIFVSDMSFATLTGGFREDAGGTFGTISLSDGTHSTSFTVLGAFTRAAFGLKAEGAGTLIYHH